MTIDLDNDVNEGEEVNKVVTTPVSGIIRKLSNLERAFLWNPYSNAVIAARIKGNISEEKIKRSLMKVRQIHPFLGVKILFDKNHDAWFSTDNVPSPDIKIVSRLTDTQWFEEFQENIKIPFNLEKGPLIRFILLHSEEVSDLIIISSHSICDGMSLIYLIRDLLKNYKDTQQENKVTSPLDIMDYLPTGGFSLSSIMIRILVKYANWRWKRNPYYFTIEDYNALYNAYWEKNSFGTVLAEFEPQETESLSKLCKENGVSIGSAVAMAFIAAYEDVIGFVKKKKQISVPLDLRRHATAAIGDVFCLCAGASQFPYDYDVKKSFWENASILHEEIHNRVNNLDSFGMEVLDSDPTLLDALSCFAFFERFIPDAYYRTENLLRFSQDKKNIAFNILKISERMFPDIDIANLGRLNIPDTYGDLRIDRIIPLPAAIRDNIPLTLGGVGIGGKMVFSLNYPQPKDMDDSRIREMIQVRNKALEYLGFPGKISERALF